MDGAEYASHNGYTDIPNVSDNAEHYALIQFLLSFYMCWDPLYTRITMHLEFYLAAATPATRTERISAESERAHTYVSTAPPLLRKGLNDQRVHFGLDSRITALPVFRPFDNDHSKPNSDVACFFKRKLPNE
ncbi:hypothetical protein OUZ56_022727 [Daphnia magna]|uniref:Uncharacterized protein n=1 Tax=Daphnia magna TaxID=35525 RepID=A0ABR0AY01_9CRUS|nr:hypothetical protein OUZ56_022727 [Daphnia magna]